MKTGITLLGTIICTILVYYLLFNEYDTLFYVNVVSTCVVEIIILSGIPLFSEKKLLTFKNAAIWNIITILAGLFFAWTTIYTLLLSNEENLNTLYIGQLLIGILFIILFGIVEIGGSTMQKQEETRLKTIQVKKGTIYSIQSYWFDIKELLNDKTIWSEETLRQVHIVFDKISSIPANKIKQNEEKWEEIQTKIEELRSLCESYAEDKGGKDIIQQKILLNIKSIRNQVSLFKL